MKTYKLSHLVISVFVLIGNLLSASVPKVQAVLKSVFTNQVNSRNKEIIKLYDDKSYEFLFFDFYNKKARVKREKGTYRLKHEHLILKNLGKSQPKKHADRFVIKESNQLVPCNKLGRIIKSEKSTFTVDNDKKYWEKTYQDSVFGQITNDKRANRKIIEVKPPYVPVNDEKVFSDYEHNKNESKIIDLSLISRDSLRRLKAIIIVGPTEGLTGSFILEQQRTAAYLRSVGVRVVEFYDTHARWKDIVEESKGAHIFIYSGHGSASLLCLSDGIVYGNTISQELKLHKNALVIFNHACQSAGSSSTDKGDIGNLEALRRVGDYAKPYIDLEAGAYFANNYSNCLPSFFKSFFQRTRMQDLYIDQASSYEKIEVVKRYKYDLLFEIGISSRKNNKGISDYNVAYVGKPDFTVMDLFK